MVASLSWRKFLLEELEKAKNSKSLKKTTKGRCFSHVRPIALTDTAYQMPSRFCEINFIRFVDMCLSESGTVLMNMLTESLCKILRDANKGNGEKSESVEKVSVFLSHAKADGVKIPKKIRNYIHAETQCDSFFDENNIAYGEDFKNKIETSISSDSAGLLVVQGDHYADRPWCRKEVRDFLKPQIFKGKGAVAPIVSCMPCVIVCNFQGDKVAKHIPELGHASSLAWRQNAEKVVVGCLMSCLLYTSPSPRDS